LDLSLVLLPLEIKEDPVEGIYTELVNDNLFEWKCFIEGPKDTPFQGGIFQALLTFPDDYPMMPPKMQFISEFWHPNVYPDGKVCISILHEPGDDPMSGEQSSERWRPTQTVTSILLSVISMLSDPNISSPANVDASVEFRDKKVAFSDRVKKLSEKSKKGIPDYVKIPHPDTDPEERAKAIKKLKLLQEEDTAWMEEDPGDDDIIDMSDDGDGGMSAGSDEEPVDDDE